MNAGQLMCAAQSCGDHSILSKTNVPVRQHFRYLDLARFNEPAVENFQKQIALKIDKDWLGTVLAVTGVAKRSTVSKGAPAKRIKKIHVVWGYVQLLARPSQLDREGR